MSHRLALIGGGKLVAAMLALMADRFCRNSPVSRPAKHRLSTLLGTSVILLSTLNIASRAADREQAIRTRTSIKHLIVVIGENRGFDHIFGAYIPPRRGQHIANLLSRGIINKHGSPGPNFREAAQFTVMPQAKYFMSAPHSSKTPYLTLPPPDLHVVPQAGSDTNPPPFASERAAEAAEPSLNRRDLVLLTTGASGLLATSGPDTRIANVTVLPNGPYQQTAKDWRNGQGLAYDAYTEDTEHRFFQMWQQSDCDVRHATARNPTGCISDLYPFVMTTFFEREEQGSGTPMAFFNMNAGDAPFLKSLADRFTLADNYHQAVMGGTGPNHIMLGTGDMVFFSDGAGNPLPPSPPPINPPISVIADPDPVLGSNNFYKNDVTKAPERHVRRHRHIRELRRRYPAGRSGDYELPALAAFRGGIELCAQTVLCRQQCFPRLPSRWHAGQPGQRGSRMAAIYSSFLRQTCPRSAMHSTRTMCLGDTTAAGSTMQSLASQSGFAQTAIRCNTPPQSWRTRPCARSTSKTSSTYFPTLTMICCPRCRSSNQAYLSMAIR